MNLENYNLVLFKEISKFTNELSNLFGNKTHPLKLYNRLINKTTISHDVAIKKHIGIFKKFCDENSASILNKDSSKLKNYTIEIIKCHHSVPCVGYGIIEKRQKLNSNRF